mgnify:CR=1 FL=1
MEVVADVDGSVTPFNEMVAWLVSTCALAGSVPKGSRTVIVMMPEAPAT